MVSLNKSSCSNVEFKHPAHPASMSAMVKLFLTADLIRSPFSRFKKSTDEDIVF